MNTCEIEWKSRAETIGRPSETFYFFLFSLSIVPEDFFHRSGLGISGGNAAASGISISGRLSSTDRPTCSVRCTRLFYDGEERRSMEEERSGFVERPTVEAKIQQPGKKQTMTKMYLKRRVLISSMSSISSSALLEKSCRMSALSPPPSFSKIPLAVSATEALSPPASFRLSPFSLPNLFCLQKRLGGKSWRFGRQGEGDHGDYPFSVGDGRGREERRGGRFFEARKIYPYQTAEKDSPPHSERSAREKSEAA